MLIANISPRTGGKTTNSGWMSHALQETGEEVEGFDADHSFQFHSWSQRGGFTFPVQKTASAKFHTEIKNSADKIGIIDCGHTENHPDITDSVLRIADLVIIHMAPTKADFDRIVEPNDKVTIRDMIRRSAALRDDATPPPAWVLLNRAVSGAKSTDYYRTEMKEEGFQVLTTTIPRSEMYAQSIGFPVQGASKGVFGELITELKTRGLMR